MRLIIEMYNLREDKGAYLVNKMIKLFRYKFEKKLKKAKKKETNDLNFMFEDNPEDKKGFKILISGDPEEVKKEYKIIKKEFGDLESSKRGAYGLQVLNMTGLYFNYYIEK